MTHGWTNLKQRQEQLRQLEKHYREVGYSDGYALKVAQSLNVEYQQGWRRGRDARQAFDRDNLLNDLDDAS
jgi:hypothetical protein